MWGLRVMLGHSYADLTTSLSSSGSLLLADIKDARSRKPLGPAPQHSLRTVLLTRLFLAWVRAHSPTLLAMVLMVMRFLLTPEL